MEKDGLRSRAGGAMYQRLKQELLARIRKGEFPPGSQLPSENQLCKEYGVSVTTTRRAFLELVNEGIVVRRAGVGTMVAPQVRKVRLSFVSVDYVGDAWRNISSVMGEIIAGVGECTWKNDATLNMVGVEEHEAAAYFKELVSDRLSDGVLIRTANDVREEYIDILEDAGIPYVVIKRHIPGRKMNSVISDDVEGARMATSHLLDLGYERIGLVCAKPDVSVGRERVAGYRSALLERGLRYDESLVRQEPYFTAEMGYRATKSLLEVSEPLQALFVASDTMALGAYRAARDLGFRVPEDLAVVGYDDIVAAAVMQPPLTTIRTSFYDFGAMAAELLLGLVEGREVSPSTRVIKPSLVVRDSAKSLVFVREQKVELSPEDVSNGVETRKASNAPAEYGYSSGLLQGREIVCSFADRSVESRVARACEADGANVELAGDFRRAIISANPDAQILTDSTGRADVLVYGFSNDGTGELNRALSHARAVAEQMRSHGGGVILFVTSRVREGDVRGAAELAASEAALRQATRFMNDELVRSGTRVNALIYDGNNWQSSLSSLTRITTFLASEEAASIGGETLSITPESSSLAPKEGI